MTNEGGEQHAVIGLGRNGDAVQLAILVAIGLLPPRIVARKSSVIGLDLCVRPEPSGSYMALSEFTELEEANLFSAETGVLQREAALGSDVLVGHRHNNE
jgi:hypothetical protein